MSSSDIERPSSRRILRQRRTHQRGTSQDTESSRFTKLMGTSLGSPFLTTAELADDNQLVDGASFGVSHSMTVTRPASPTVSVDYSIINAPTDYYTTPQRSRPLYPTPSHGYSMSPSPNSLKALLPRIWDALSSPGKKGKARLLRDEDYSDLAPLDGEEDIVALAPPEISLQLLMFLDLPSILACLAVSKTWRSLAGDNAVWRELFVAQNWEVDVDRANLRRQEHPYVHPATSRLGQVLEEWGRRTRLSSQSSATSTQRSTRSGTVTPRSVTKKLPVVPWSSPECIPETSASSFPSYDWRALYKTRLELERRWTDHDPKKTVLSGHADSVYCLEIDSARIITGSRDKSIKIWSLHTGRLFGTYHGHHGSVLCVKFEKDWDVPRHGQLTKTGFMVSGSSDCTVRVWSLHIGDNEEVRAETRAVLRGHSGGVLDLRIDDEWIVSCSKDALICVWNRESLELHCTLRGHQGPVNAVGLQSGRVVSASGDGRMMLWDIKTRSRIRTFDGHDRGLACIEFKDDRIVSGSNDCKIKVWSASTGQCLNTLVGHELLVRALSFNPVSNRLVSGSYDKSIKVWNLDTGKIIRDIKTSHTSHIFDVKFDVSRIVSTSHDQKVVILDFADGLDTALFA